MSELSQAVFGKTPRKWWGTGGNTARIAHADSERAARKFKREVQYNRFLFALQACVGDFLAVLLAFAISDFTYNLAAHSAHRSLFENAQLGTFAAFMFVIFNLARHTYTLTEYLELTGHAERVFSLWNYAFLAAATTGFMLHAIGESSRGAFIVFYFTGLAALYANRAVMVRLVRRRTSAGNLLTARVMIVGFSSQIDQFLKRRALSRYGMKIVSVCALDKGGDASGAGTTPDAEAMIETELVRAVEAARRLLPDDIIVVAPLEHSAIVERCLTAFMRTPVAIHLHLDRDNPLLRFSGQQFKGDNAISSLRLPAASISPLGAVSKRLCDIVLSAGALIALSPLLALIAIAIKLDSPGPVLYVQSRHGFNKKKFSILKFRSMRTLDKDANVVQAVVNDPRITRCGRFIRRFNFDELPQLLNVLRGEMSLVGPRPHALAHDRAFETDISLYARRHNIKPGITGWAQVNGFRGETDSQEKIWQRVHYDLHYIDNWSLRLDIWILFLTLFSRKAYSNAR
ncbi:MAG: exopolysaccharide biosynthesis polyprenyl glycosylphosphotransferase [Rhodoblastus sp.]